MQRRQLQQTINNITITSGSSNNDNDNRQKNNAAEFDKLRLLYDDAYHAYKNASSANHKTNEDESINSSKTFMADNTATTTTRFRLENLDLHNKARPVTCGRNKCFVRLKKGAAAAKATNGSSSHHYPEEEWEWGYLVAPADKAWHILEQSKATQYLVTKYGADKIPHFLAGPPVQLSNVSLALMQALNRQAAASTTQMTRLKQFIARRTQKKATNTARPPQFNSANGGSIVVQLCRVAPVHTVLFKARREAGNSAPKFRHKVLRFLAVRAANATTFAHNLRTQLHFVMDTLLLQEPWLAVDFQVLVDAAGRVYYLDLGKTKSVVKERQALQHLWRPQVANETRNNEKNHYNKRELEALQSIVDMRQQMTMLVARVEYWSRVASTTHELDDLSWRIGAFKEGNPLFYSKRR